MLSRLHIFLYVYIERRNSGGNEINSLLNKLVDRESVSRATVIGTYLYTLQILGTMADNIAAVLHGPYDIRIVSIIYLSFIILW